MLIDTHCHLDASEFDLDRIAVAHAAAVAGVGIVVIPAIEIANLKTVNDLAHQWPGGRYALGIHPLFVRRAGEGDLDLLRAAIEAALPDPRFVAIGEIGLDFFVSETASGAERDKQIHFYDAQLRMALDYDLPVLLHVRRSQDIILKHIRRLPRSPGGIAHAYNGSDQQTDAFLDYGFALGVGGAMTYTRSTQIRRHAQCRDLSNIVLETDSPDIAPAWLSAPDRRNTPDQIRGIAHALAELRGCTVAEIERETTLTAHRVLPRLLRSL